MQVTLPEKVSGMGMSRKTLEVSPPGRAVEVDQHLPKTLDALRATLLMLLALGHNCGTEAAAEIFGQFIELRVTINLNSLFGRVANHVAVVAPGEMVLQLDFGGFVEDAVQVVGQLVQKLRAFHWLPSPLSRFWK